MQGDSGQYLYCDHSTNGNVSLLKSQVECCCTSLLFYREQI